ncbi:MAG: hypothetical protein K8R92_02705 [Planctomycetes bacterium]|nr:hypothetical protein [Planctomycetota bacterium]
MPAMGQSQWTKMAIGGAAVAVAATALTQWLCGGIGGMDLWSVWLLSGWKTALWLLSAYGLGALAVGLREGERPSAPVIGLAFGLALQVALDQWLGSLGLLHGAASIGALVPGWILAIHFHLRGASARNHAPNTSLGWWWPALPAAVALLIAASISPGVMWSSEFGGYDALEYHLQAPKEWLAIGAIRPLDHLAYSGMPNFIEGAFLHVMCLGGDPRDAAVACQLLHASLLVVAALVLADLAAMAARQWRLSEDAARVATACALVGTPWMIVTGSLAYTESGILLSFATLLHLLAGRSISSTRSGLMIGVLVAMLVGSKASSVILVLPAVLAWAILLRSRKSVDWKALACAISALLACLAPWMLRNGLVAGTPFFPFLTELLGSGWWNSEQAQRWNQAHASGAHLLARLHALWNQLFTFGLGDPPIDGEPWKWFWGPLPWIGAASMAGLAYRSSTRGIATTISGVCLLIVLGWLFGTHLQSRFLIPLAVPLALAFGLTAAGMTGAPRARIPLKLFLFAWACLPLWWLTTDTPGAAYFIGQNAYFTGDEDWRDLHSSDRAIREDAQNHLTTEVVINHLHPEWRVLSVGWSTPFWIRPGANLTWSTVWDRNPIEACRGLTASDTAAMLSKDFDAIVIDLPMLERWKRSGWLSPNIDLDQMTELSNALPRLAKLKGGRVLLGLRGHSTLGLP